MRNYTIDVPFMIGDTDIIDDEFHGLYQAKLNEEQVRKLYEKTYGKEFTYEGQPIDLDELTIEDWYQLGATLHDMLACALEDSTVFFDLIYDIL